MMTQSDMQQASDEGALATGTVTTVVPDFLIRTESHHFCLYAACVVLA